MKKLLSMTLALALCMSMFAACGSKPSTSAAAPAASAAASAPAEKTAEPATITYWYWADNSDYSATMQDMIKDFNDTNGKGITVVGEEYPWDGGAYSENLFNAVMGGGGPDVSSFKLTSTPLFTANNLLANLDPIIADWADKSKIPDNLWNIMKQASGTDSVYVMPWNIQVLYVYYRPSVFKEAGVEVPKTYDEFLNCIEKCTMDTNGDGKIDVYGFGMRGAKGGQEPWGNFLYGAGGSFEDMTTADSVKGMQDFIDVYQKGYAPKSAPNDGFSEIIANFQNGTTAMTVHHTGSSAKMIETFGDDVSAFAFPAGKGQWTSMGDTENVMMESSKNKEAAAEWLKYLAAGKGQQTWCETTGNVPVSAEVQALPFFQENRFMKASIDGIDYAGILPILDTTTEWISAVWPNTVSAALLGEKTAEEACAELQKALYVS
ncbi:MAG: sugar ABC transporter substrate-binding protein [Ruthenibacterium sp.]